jgi:hypothetical protein
LTQQGLENPYDKFHGQLTPFIRAHSKLTELDNINCDVPLLGLVWLVGGADTCASPTRVISGIPHTQSTWSSKLERTKLRPHLAYAGTRLSTSRICKMSGTLYFQFKFLHHSTLIITERREERENSKHSVRLRCIGGPGLAQCGMV